VRRQRHHQTSSATGGVLISASWPPTSPRSAMCVLPLTASAKHWSSATESPSLGAPKVPHLNQQRNFLPGDAHHPRRPLPHSLWHVRPFCSTVRAGICPRTLTSAAQAVSSTSSKNPSACPACSPGGRLRPDGSDSHQQAPLVDRSVRRARRATSRLFGATDCCSTTESYGSQVRQHARYHFSLLQRGRSVLSSYPDPCPIVRSPTCISPSSSDGYTPMSIVRMHTGRRE